MDTTSYIRHDNDVIVGIKINNKIGKYGLRWVVVREEKEFVYFVWFRS